MHEHTGVVIFINLNFNDIWNSQTYMWILEGTLLLNK